jgi:prophage regulatory protein
MKILRMREVISRVGLSRATIYRRASQGTFPKSIKLGARSTGWLKSEVDEWIKERITTRDNLDATRD